MCGRWLGLIWSRPTTRLCWSWPAVRPLRLRQGRGSRWRFGCRGRPGPRGRSSMPGDVDMYAGRHDRLGLRADLIPRGMPRFDPACWPTPAALCVVALPSTCPSRYRPLRPHVPASRKPGHYFADWPLTILFSSAVVSRTPSTSAWLLTSECSKAAALDQISG